jgi:hypothetical protein
MTKALFVHRSGRASRECAGKARGTRRESTAQRASSNLAVRIMAVSKPVPRITSAARLSPPLMQINAVHQLQHIVEFI